MIDIRPIFWSQIDARVVRFPLYNKCLQKTSMTYPVYFVYSGGEECVNTLKNVYPNAIFVPCSHNNDNEKAKILFELLKQRTDYDVLIRTCCDSVIVDVPRLLNILRDNLLGKHAIIGNIATNKDGTPHHVRGGCNAVTRSVIERIDMPIEMAKGRSEFDKDFSYAVIQTGAEIIDYKLFWMGPSKFFEFPACHVIRRPKKNRLKSLREIVALAEKSNEK